MKNILMIAVVVALIFPLSGCNKSKLKPYVVKSYTVVNNTIGKIRQTPSIVTNNIGTFITASKVVKAALEFLGKQIGEAKMKPYVDAMTTVIAELEAIQADPSQVTTKIEQVLVGLEKARDGIVEAAKWVGCEGDLPAPKANAVSIADLTTSADELQKLLDGKK